MRTFILQLDLSERGNVPAIIAALRECANTLERNHATTLVAFDELAEAPHIVHDNGGNTFGIYQLLEHEELACDGSGPHDVLHGTRALPVGASANAILCRSCYAAELAWRAAQNTLEGSARYDLPPWDTARAIRVDALPTVPPIPTA